MKNLNEQIERINQLSNYEVGVVINEGGEQKVLGCHEMDKLEQYCKLPLTTKDADNIVLQNTPKAIADLQQKLDKFISELIAMGGEDTKVVSKKFSKSITNLKPSITNSITKYYKQSVYASCKLSTPINPTLILAPIIKMIYDEFVKLWESAWVERNVASAFVNKKNIKSIKETTKDIWEEIVLQFVLFLEFFYIDWGYHKVKELVEIKNKTTTEKCTAVIFTQDEYCKKLPKPISPNKKFFATYPIGGSDKEFDKMVGTYLPYIDKLLDGLV
jgi:hypothetical protein